MSQWFRQVTRVTIFVITVSLFSHCATAKSICPLGYYRDPVTYKCDDCGFICENAEIQNTEDQCSEYCPDYQHTVQAELRPPRIKPSLTSCAPGTYRDRFVGGKNGKCEPCSGICDGHQIQGTTAECMKKCPGYEDSDSRKSSGDVSTDPVSIAVYSIVGIVSLLALCAALVLVLWIRGHRKQVRCWQPKRRPHPCSGVEKDTAQDYTSKDALMNNEDKRQEQRGEIPQNLGFSELTESFRCSCKDNIT